MEYRDNSLPKPYEGTENYVFISYSRKDKEIVYADLLEMNKIGVRFWYDDGISAGENWKEIVSQKISSPRCVGVVFYLSKNVLFSESIEFEIKQVFGAEVKDHKNSFSILIDYSNNASSLEQIIEEQWSQQQISEETASRLLLIKTIFGGETNYLQRNPEPNVFVNHFYKTILRISNFGAVSIDALQKLVPDYSDFSFKDIKNGLKIVSYRGKEESVRIPSRIFDKDIISLGKDLFKENHYLKEVYIPNSVTEIEEKCFYRCSQLSKVTINVFESELHSIGDRAFYDCFRLEKLEIPCSIKTIGLEAFGECEYSDQTIPQLFFYAMDPPIFDPECADGSKLFVPLLAKEKYIQASGLSQNVYSILEKPDGLTYENESLHWNAVFGATAYEIDEDDIPIAIKKTPRFSYTPKTGLHSIRIRALGSFKNRIISSIFSSELICGETPESEFCLDDKKEVVLIYRGVNRIVVLPPYIKRVVGSVLIFYNVIELHIPASVEEIEYKTVCGIEKLIIDKSNPHFYVLDGKIYKSKDNSFFRDVVLGETFELDGKTYYTKTQTQKT